MGPKWPKNCETDPTTIWTKEGMDMGWDGPAEEKLFTFVDCHCERPHVLSISWSVRKVVLFTLRTHTRMFDFISAARHME